MTGPPDELSPTYYLTCMQCRYRLRGLAPDALCPECGTQIARSIQWWGERLARTPWWRRPPVIPGPLLREGDARWLRRVAAGTWALAATWVAAAAWVAIRAASPWKSLVPDYVLFAVGAGYFLSAWLLTAGEKRADVWPLWDAARWALRGAAFGTCAATWLALQAERVPAHDFAGYTSAAVTIGWLCIPWAAFVTFAYLGHHAARLPDRWTAATCRVLGYGIAWAMTPFCIGDVAELGRFVSPRYRERYSSSPDTLAESLDGLLRTCGAAGYAGYAFILLILLSLAWRFTRCARRPSPPSDSTDRPAV
jgi:hypothetical protein